MTRPLAFRIAMTVALFVFAGILVPSLAAGPPPESRATGDLWEVTSQMQMEGMAMPAQKPVKVCTAKESNEPPGGADERMKCTNSDYKRDGAKATWKTVCAGPPQMTGEGEITFDGSNSYSGTIKFNSSDGNMTIKISGRRIDDCVPAKK